MLIIMIIIVWWQWVVIVGLNDMVKVGCNFVC